MSKTMRQTEK